MMHEGRHDRRSLVSRFAASTAVLAALVVVAAVIFFLFTGPFFQGTMGTKLQGYSSTMAEHIFHAPHLSQTAAERHNLYVVVEQAAGTMAYGPDGQPVDPSAVDHLSIRYRRVQVTRHDGMSIIFYWDMLDYAHEHVLALVSLVALLLVTIAITYAFQLTQLRPLQRLRGGVEAVSKGDLDVRVPVVRNDEIGQVAAAFNTMTERVRQMVEGRERLLADVSHELRSPLARMKVALELMPEGDKREALARDVRQMESLTTVLLERERLRAQIDRLQKEDVRLRQVVDEALVDRAGSQPAVVWADEAAAALAIDPIIAGDAALLRVLIDNLLDNALKYALPDSQAVTVSLQASAQPSAPSSVDRVVLVVEDDGPGIPEKERQRVFEPFVKLDPARGHGSGVGLGLNLCQRIVASHAGTIQLLRREPRGTRVEIELPVRGRVA